MSDGSSEAEERKKARELARKNEKKKKERKKRRRKKVSWFQSTRVEPETAIVSAARVDSIKAKASLQKQVSFAARGHVLFLSKNLNKRKKGKTGEKEQENKLKQTQRAW